MWIKLTGSAGYETFERIKKVIIIDDHRLCVVYKDGVEKDYGMSSETIIIPSEKNQSI